jgi:hippurate hydrolase
VVQNVVATFGATARFHYERNYPVTVNHAEQTEKAVSVARDVAGVAHVEPNAMPVMGGEDFSFMLEARPGAFIFVGNGDTAGLHHPAYDFNDAAIPYGSSYWARLVERLMPA